MPNNEYINEAMTIVQGGGTRNDYRDANNNITKSDVTWQRNGKTYKATATGQDMEETHDNLVEEVASKLASIG